MGPMVLTDPKEEAKGQFIGGKRCGRLGAITITFRRKRDVEDARALIALKMAPRS